VSTSLATQGTTLALASRQASTDQQLIDLWLHGRSQHTQRAYRGDVDRFLAVTAQPLAQTTLGDLQTFADSLDKMAPTSRARILSAVKSLLAFANRTGYLPLNVGAALRLPARKFTLAERILPEADVQRLLALESNQRNRVMLRLLYAGGLRAAELGALRWRDLQDRGKDGGQVTVYGKGGKTRVVLLPPTVWRELMALSARTRRATPTTGRPRHGTPEPEVLAADENSRGVAGPDAPVFRSRRGGHLDESAVWRIVRAAARRAGINLDVSPHWLRHAHASHALDRGAPIHLVQATLGHASVATTGRYLHARPTDSSSRYLAV
jgi:integrase/recombinase XerD